MRDMQASKRIVRKPQKSPNSFRRTVGLACVDAATRGRARSAGSHSRLYFRWTLSSVTSVYTGNCLVSNGKVHDAFLKLLKTP